MVHRLEEEMNLDFKARFIDPIRSGRKSQTIRTRRYANIGGPVHLFHGLRRSGCIKIGSATIIDAFNIDITPGGVCWITGQRLMSEEEKLDLAVRDGFETFSELYEFMSDLYGKSSHSMTVIRWAQFRKAVGGVQKRERR